MLYVSRASRYRVSFRGKQKIFAPNGETIDERPRIFAEFTHGPVPDWAMKQVLKRLDFGFLPDGWTPEMQISSFDSVVAQNQNGWKDSEREALEEHLARQVGEDYILVEPERAPKPWATYDKLFARKGMTQEQAVEKIISIVVDTGIDPQLVIDYEQENKNRADVIEAMVSLSEVHVDDGDILVGA